MNLTIYHSSLFRRVVMSFVRHLLKSYIGNIMKIGVEEHVIVREIEKFSTYDEIDQLFPNLTIRPHIQ